MTPLKKPGDTLTWVSGAAGSQKEKRGKVLAVLPANYSLSRALAKLGRVDITKGRIMAMDCALSDRYLVEVLRGSGVDLYAPLVKTIDGKLRRMARPEKAATR